MMWGKTKLLTPIVSLLLACVSLTYALAAYTPDYRQWFQEAYGSSSINQARSPFRDGTADNFGNITSNCNQPRMEGTIVHNGTDFGRGGVLNREVYSVMVGKVEKIVHSGTNSYVLLSYGSTMTIIYQHIAPNPNISVGQWLSSDNLVGTLINIPYTKPDGSIGYNNHLHMAARDGTGTYVRKLSPYYGHVQQWGYGEYMDYFSKDSLSGNDFSISARYLAGGVSYRLTRIEVYYRINNGVWQGPAYMTHSGSDRWAINLRTATGAPSGSTLDFYLAGIAPAGWAFSYYDWGLWPQHYATPPKMPAEFTSPLIYRSVSIQ